MTQSLFCILALSDQTQLYAIFTISLIVFYFVMSKHYDYGLLSEAVYKTLLLQKLDSLGAQVIDIRNVSGAAFPGAVRVFRVKFITRRGHEIDGYFYVGHGLFGVMFGHIRFKREYKRKDPSDW